VSQMGNPAEPLVKGYLESIGISLLMDWDILIFLYRHGVVLSNTDQIARLMNCESTTTFNALNRLESRGLIESSRPSRGVRFYKAVISSGVSHQSTFQQLLSLTGNRTGRLTLTKILKSNTREGSPGVISINPS
jgi:hypothetical protein